MRKLFTSLLLMLSVFMLQAQDLEWGVYGIQPDQPLVSSADQLSSPYSDEAEGLHIEYLVDGDINTFWHSDWHGRVSGTPYLDIALTEPTEGYMALCIGRRNSSNTCQFTNMEVQTSADGEQWESMGTSVMPYLSLNEYVASTPFYMPEDTKHIRVYCVGRSNTTNTINEVGIGTFHMAEFQMYRVEDNFGKEYDLNNLLLKYDEYIGGGSLNMGEGFGQYSDYAAEQAFLNGLSTASEILASGNLSDYTNAQVQEIVETVEKSYAAVLASEVPFKLANDGYYRIVCNMNYYEEKETGDIDLDGNPVMEQTPVTKALYATIEGMACWGTRDDADCRFLWRLEQKDGGIRMMNAATLEQLSGVNADNKVLTSAEADTLMAFDYVASQDGHDILYIRFAGAQKDMSGNSSVYLHQLSHQQGKGTGDALCIWAATWDKTNGDKGTSEYWLEPVSDEEAQKMVDEFAVIRDHDKMVLKYQETIELAKAALAFAKEGAYTPLVDKALITDAAQFTSLWSDPDEGTSFEPLLDTDPATFWHSTWHGSSFDYPTHSFEVALPENTTGTVMAYIQRRSANDDHITRMSVYGTDDETLLVDPVPDAWEFIQDELNTPWSAGQESVYTPIFELKKPYKYLRFYVTNTAGSNYTYRNFFHMGGFQLYPVEKSGNCQYDHMAEAGDRLQAIVDAYRTMDITTLTVEQYNELMAAYEAFAPLVVDPTPLRNAIASNRKAGEVITVGTNPGYWADMSSAEKLAALIAEAEAYDKTANLTHEQSEAYITQINEAAAAIMTSIIPVDPNKWYRIRFATREQYEENGWSITNADSETGMSLLGKVIVPGTYVEATEENAARIDVLPLEDIREGCAMHYVDSEMLSDDAYYTYRFVPIEEGRWAIQHKLTGMYLQRDRYHGGQIRLQVQPTKVDVKPLGKGQVAFVLEDLAGFTWEQNYMNGWRDHCQLQTWTAENAGSNSGLFIDEVEEIVEDDFEPYYYRDVNPGNIYGICYPSPMQMFDGTMYSPVGTFEEGDDQYIALKQIEQAAAGEPFLFIANGDYNAEATATATVQLGSEVVKEPVTVNGLTGHFTPQFIEGGHILFLEGKAQVKNGQNVNVVSNEAYLAYGVQPVTPEVEHDLALQIDGHATTGIQEVVNKVNRPGHIYNLNGQMVKANGTMSDVKRLQPGTYILNGVKIRVK